MEKRGDMTQQQITGTILVAAVVALLVGATAYAAYEGWIDLGRIQDIFTFWR